MSGRGKQSTETSDSQWYELRDTVSALHNAVIALIVVITLFCVLQAIAVIYRFCAMRRISHFQRKTERMRDLVARQKPLKRRRRKSSTMSTKRRSTKKHKKTKTVGPSKRAMVRLSLSHDEDQPREFRKTVNDRTDTKDRKSQQLMDRSKKAETIQQTKQPSKGQVNEDAKPKMKVATDNKKGMSSTNTTNEPLTGVTAELDKQGKPMASDSSSSATYESNKEIPKPVAKDSLMMTNDEKLFPVELDSPSNLLKEKKNSGNASGSAITTKAQGDNLNRDDKQANVKTAENKNSERSTNSASSKKGQAIVEIPETAIANGSKISTAKENSVSTANKIPGATKPSSSSNESSKSTKSSNDFESAPIHGKVLEFTIGV